MYAEAANLLQATLTLLTLTLTLTLALILTTED